MGGSAGITPFQLLRHYALTLALPPPNPATPSQAAFRITFGLSLLFTVVVAAACLLAILIAAIARRARDSSDSRGNESHSDWWGGGGGGGGGGGFGWHGGRFGPGGWGHHHWGGGFGFGGVWEYLLLRHAIQPLAEAHERPLWQAAREPIAPRMPAADTAHGAGYGGAGGGYGGGPDGDGGPPNRPQPDPVPRRGPAVAAPRAEDEPEPALNFPAAVFRCRPP
jgi:hypothetical protein